jgi:hypothetical protein
LLTDHEIARTWRSLFQRGEFTEETFAKAEALLDELRPENPLQHRLRAELVELRRRQTKPAKPAKQTARR